MATLYRSAKELKAGIYVNLSEILESLKRD